MQQSELCLHFKSVSYTPYWGSEESLKDQTGSGILVIKIDFKFDTQLKK